MASTRTSKAHKRNKVSRKKKAPRGKQAKTRTHRFGGGRLLERLPSDILADMSDLVVVFDEDYIIKFLNEAAKKVYGDTVGRKCHQVIRNLDMPCHHAGIRCQIRELVEEGKALHEDTRLAGVTGRVLHIRSRPTTTADGKKAIIGVYRDITEETKATEGLRRSEERFRIAAESASDLIWEWDIPSGRLDWFGKIDELLGYAFGEFPRTMEVYMRIVHPEDRERVAAALDRHLNGQAPYCEEYRVLRKDGAILHWKDSGTVLRDVKGKPYRMIGACSDIADQKRLKESEKALREQQSLLQQVIDNIPTPIFHKDTNGLYQGCNTAYERFIGFPKERLIGRSVYNLWPKDLADKYYEMDSELFKKPGSQAYETSTTHADGTRHDVIFNKATYTDAYGKVAGIVAVITDITQRKQIEKQLEESLSILNATLESTADGILVISQDEKVTGYNQRYVEMFHTPESFLRLKDDRQIVTFVQEQMKDPEGFLRRTRELFDNPELEKSDVLEFRDRRVYERHSRPHRIGEKIVGRVISFRDITERRRAEERLKESEEFNRSLLLNSASPVFVANPDGSIRYVSPALEAVTGYSSSELIEMKPPYPYWPEDQREERIKRHEEHILHGIKRFEESFQRKNGEFFWVEINSSPVKDEEGAVKYYLSIWTDITERKRMEEKLRLYSENLEKLVEDRGRELKRSEAKYRLLVNNMADVVFAIDLAGNFTFISSPAEKMTGYPAEKLLAMNMKELITPEYLLTYWKDCKGASRGRVCQHTSLK